MSRVIHKFALNLERNVFPIDDTAIALSVGIQEQAEQVIPVIWVQRDPELPNDHALIVSVIATGEVGRDEELEEATFLGTIHRNGIYLHVFSKMERPCDKIVTTDVTETEKRLLQGNQASREDKKLTA